MSSRQFPPPGNSYPFQEGQSIDPSPVAPGDALVHEEKDTTPKRLQTIQSKFLHAVSDYAATKNLEMVVHLDTPNSGYCYIQKEEGFSNLYSFYFEFNAESATFYLGTDKVSTASLAGKRIVDFGGARLEQVLDEIRQAIDDAPTAPPEAVAPPPATEGTSVATSSVSTISPSPPPPRDTKTEHMQAASMWSQDAFGTKLETKVETKERTVTRSGVSAIVVAVALLAVFLLFFVPFFQTTISTCAASAGSCIPGAPVTHSTYYSSASYQLFGVGGQLFPPNQGWKVHSFFGVGSSVSGATIFGFAIGAYYFLL